MSHTDRLPAFCLVIAALLSLLLPASVSAQAAPAPPRFGIADNSFLVEEAFNQERGIFQNIFVFTRSKGGGFEAAFTQEWPLTTQRHQLSYTLSGAIVDGAGMLGDVLVNYRLQVATEVGHPAFSPRLSVILPAGAERRALGRRGVGWQVNLPFSKRAGAAYFHWNAGATFTRGTDTGAWEQSTYAAGSIIVAVRRMFHVMFESVVASDDEDARRTRTVTVVPGFRTGWNLGEKQIVVGAGVPVTRGGRHDVAGLIYFSYELPFRK